MRHELPQAACDAHAHVFPPVEQFPLAEGIAYSPPIAPFDAYRDMLARVGMRRGVLVQPTAYGTDTRALVDALSAGRGWLCGIAAATRAVRDDELDALHAAGVRGLRFIEMTDPRGGRYSGGIGVYELRILAPRLRERGWHAQIWASAEDHAALLPSLVPLGIPIVIDHMGSFTAERGVHDAAFQRIISHLAAGEIWVKLSVCRNSRARPHYPDVRAFHDALVAANSRRLLWGSDWPHVRMGELAPDVGMLVDLFHEWVDDAKLRQAILVDNPHELFGFTDMQSHALREDSNVRR